MDPVTGLPVRGCISLYEASGLIPMIQKYSEEHDGAQITPYDNLLCNFATLQRIKTFLEDQWGYYSINIDKDNHVFWDTKKYPAGTKHYKKSLTNKVKTCVVLDFTNYCCGLDDDLEDDVIVFRVFTKKPAEPVEEDKKDEA